MDFIQSMKKSLNHISDNNFLREGMNNLLLFVVYIHIFNWFFKLENSGHFFYYRYKEQYVIFKWFMKLTIVIDWILKILKWYF